MFLRSIHVIAYISSPFLFIAQLEASRDWAKMGSDIPRKNPDCKRVQARLREPTGACSELGAATGGI